MQRIRRIATANIRLFLEDANLFKHEFDAIFWADSERCSATATSSITATSTISTSSAPRRYARAEKNATSALSGNAKAKPGSGVNLFDIGQVTENAYL